MKELEYTVIFEPAEEGGYVVYVPALKGLVTQGETLEQAREMARDAILCYLETLKARNLPLPQDKSDFVPVTDKLAFAV